MTYYHHIVLQMREALYPHPEITEKILRTKQYIHSHYASDINLDQLTREAMMSKFHFIRLFRKYYGRTPHAYLKEVRLQEAKELLRSGLPIKDVCYAVGFDSIPTFTRQYKAMTGIPPARFQKSAKRAILDKKVSG